MDNTQASEATAKRLDVILSDVEERFHHEIFHRFWLENPLELAKLLHALALPDVAKSKILALKVGMPPNHDCTDLSILIDRAMQKVWQRLSEGSL